MQNTMKLQIQALPENEGFARATVAAFAAFLNPSIDDIQDIKTIVSEAVTNAIVHGYQLDGSKVVMIDASIADGYLTVKVADDGVGMEDIAQCTADNYTSDPSGERSGLGLTIIKALSDSMEIASRVGEGTTITIRKKIA